MTGDSRDLRITADGRLAGPSFLDEPRLQDLLRLLDRDGEAARVVGGAVRNALIGRPVADVDIATTAEPAAVMARVGRAGLRAIPTGLAHGTVTVLSGGMSFEVTTLRRDVETNGRHAVVRFSRDFAEDAERRDFTINALSVTGDGAVADTVGGVADLAQGLVRFIGDPDRRITEDYLRILRFFRFHAGYGLGDLDPPGLAAAIRHRDALRRLSRERIRAELLKLLVAPGACAVVNAMTAAGITERLLGRAPDVPRFCRTAVLEAAWDLPPDPMRRLAALAVSQPEDGPGLQDALRLSKDEMRQLVEAWGARQGLDPAAAPGGPGVRALLHAHGRRAAEDGLVLAAATPNPLGRAEDWRLAHRALTAAEAPRLPIDGAAVMARGVPSGRRVGAVLKRLQAAWIRAGFPDDPQHLAQLLDVAVQEEQGAAGVDQRRG